METAKVKNSTEASSEYVLNKGGSGTLPACREELESETLIDSVSIPTVLGYQLVGNPYSVSVMQQASVNLYGNNAQIVANKKYVRFKPANEQPLKVLAESELNLFDYPLDREVISDNDYYPQPGIGAEEISWLYTVVDMNYTPPADIPYEILQELYVPGMIYYLNKRL